MSFAWVIKRIYTLPTLNDQSRQQLSNWQSERRVAITDQLSPNTEFQLMELHYLLNLLVNNNAHCVLSNVIYPSSLAMVTLVGHTFLNSTHALLRGKTRK